MAENSKIEWRSLPRVIASNGYVLIRVGKNHHLSDVRGYAYEHRLVAEEVVGRRLEPGEIVHHLNGNKQDNSPDNIKVCSSIAEHLAHHRIRADLRKPGQENPLVRCLCGCGKQFRRYDSAGRPRVYQSGHNPQPAPAEESVTAEFRSHGTLLTREVIGNTGFGEGTVKRCLRKLVARGVLKRLGHGVYSLKEVSNG